MAGIDTFSVSIALRDMQKDLGTTLALVSWTVTFYLLTQTVVLPIAGKLGDEHGEKRLLVGAVLLFVISSVATGLAPNIYVLIVFRIVQALGAGSFRPLAVGIIGKVFGDRRQAPIGMLNTAFILGAIIGPNIAGVIIDSLSWRWIFFVNAPTGLAVAFFAVRVIPETKGISAVKPIDLPGIALFALGAALLLIGLTHLANNPSHIASPAVWLPIAFGLAALGLFVRHEGRAAAPLVELKLLRSAPFFAANMYSFIMGACILGFVSFVPTYARLRFGFSASETALVLTARMVVSLFLSVAASLALARMGYRKPMILGMLTLSGGLFVIGLGFTDITLFGVGVPNQLLLAMEVVLAGVGISVFTPAAQNASLDLHPQKIGAISGIRGMFNNLGAMFGGAGVVLALSHFSDKALGFERIFSALAFVGLLAIPFVFLVPDRTRREKR